MPKTSPRTTTTPRPAKSDLDQSRLSHLLGFQTSLAHVKLQKAFFSHMKDLDLRPVEFAILVLLAHNDKANQQNLCRSLSLSAPRLALVLDRLQERGLLSRERSDTDRRAHHVVLTPEGRRLALEAERLSHGMEETVLAPLSQGERQILGELLAKIVRGARA
ncbi:MarR family transcriptional regulator [Pigmentiphaga sp. GD03639]|jgi:DNA-binding MarR family transcriptional regulator|uniref:HTH marR-type domain-containing protein n=1 Tax=Pigmentiphaga daeguensis TaxID=414049 RepID=A0ABN1CL02_9BURK|nr:MULTISPECIES: MarR family transcriptional regulator [unclassified Pigmentiphaga]MDH2235792.1 MarR family transcriptional regulator [Pigmentiphaga sp. GD03639]OVZ62915.1 hypothetical protein CDO46_14405 [Pigmentiphaga sp. NML030171]